jgi:hypothetical protein
MVVIHLEDGFPSHNPILAFLPKPLRSDPFFPNVWFNVMENELWGCVAENTWGPPREQDY